MTWTSPPLVFRCGACGTQASGFTLPREMERFAQQHAELCKGFPPNPSVEPDDGLDAFHLEPEQ